MLSGRTSLGPLLRDENTNGNLTDGDDELLESLVKTATKTPATRTTPRERKRTRHADRKSCKCDPRTLHLAVPSSVLIDLFLSLRKIDRSIGPLPICFLRLFHGIFMERIFRRLVGVSSLESLFFFSFAFAIYRSFVSYRDRRSWLSYEISIVRSISNLSSCYFLNLSLIKIFNHSLDYGSPSKFSHSRSKLFIIFF